MPQYVKQNIPTLVNGTLLVVMIGWLLVVHGKTESNSMQQAQTTPAIYKLQEAVTSLQVTIAGMRPLLEAVAEKEIPPPEVLRRLKTLENRMDRFEYGNKRLLQE